MLKTVSSSHLSKITIQIIFAQNPRPCQNYFLSRWDDIRLSQYGRWELACKWLTDKTKIRRILAYILRPRMEKCRRNVLLHRQFHQAQLSRSRSRMCKIQCILAYYSQRRSLSHFYFANVYYASEKQRGLSSNGWLFHSWCSREPILDWTLLSRYRQVYVDGCSLNMLIKEHSRGWTARRLITIIWSQNVLIFLNPDFWYWRKS